MAKRIDLAGMTFGRLKVLEAAPDHICPSGKRESMWKCQCQCKKKTIRIVRTSDLRNGHTLSCGCLSWEHRKRGNEYRLLDGTVYVKLPNTDEEMLCDAEDWEILKQYSWSLKAEDSYVRARVEGKNCDFHRCVMKESSRKKYVDHINGNKLDNRKCNLRYVTTKQSNMNLGIRKNSSTGVKGVSYDKRLRRYEAYIHDEKKISLGRFDSLEEAKKVREEAEKVLYGQYSSVLSRK